MAVFIIGIPLILLIIIVEIATVALHMTGLDIKSSRFQALSAFTSTGFTTKEAESVVNHKQRRKIIMILMVTGFVTWASLVSLIVNAFLSAGELIPSIIQILSLLIIFLIILLLARHRPFVKAFRNKISGCLENRTALKGKSIDEVLRLAQNFGIATITIIKGSKNIGLSLRETALRDRDILVLAIERNNKILPAPRASDILIEGDTLICYGKLKNMQETV